MRRWCTCKNAGSMQEVWHATQRLVPSENQGYICNLGHSLSGTLSCVKKKKTLGNDTTHAHHTDKSLPSVYGTNLGREN